MSICCLSHEREREKFTTVLFTLFTNNTYEVDGNSKICSYLPSPLHTKPPERKTFFSKIPKNRLHRDLFKPTQNMKVVDKMLNYLFEHSILHTTFICHDDNNVGSLNEILKSLLRNGIIPEVVGNPRLMLVEVQQLGWRFINSINYLETRVHDLAQKLDINNFFFPMKWNKRTCFKYVGKPPHRDDFFNAEDSEAIVTAKNAFFSQNVLSTNIWSFETALKDCVKFRLDVIEQSLLNFLRDAFACQDLLHNQFQEENQIQPKRDYLMPFNPPLFTRASYAFALLLTFTSSKNDLKNTQAPIAMRSSKQELEFCTFLRHNYPQYTFVDAWSQFGQKKFKETFPDSYCNETKTAFFLMVVLYMATKVMSANKTKNYFQIPFAEALENFERKISNLQKNHPTEVRKVEVIWECLWKHRKTHDRTVQEFLKIYHEPPISRLDPAAAGKGFLIFLHCCQSNRVIFFFLVRGGINEVFNCFWKKTPNEKFYNTDIISSYPGAALEFLPVGDYEV